MKNILIIDDSALMRRIIPDIINSDEELHSERTATNGLEAINMLESGQRFDCIILDINMPKMNGIEFLKTMNRKGIKQNVIIVSTIAKEGAKETIEALELGAFDFVTKPDSLAEAKGSEFSNRLISMIYAACNVSITYIVQKAAEEVKNMVGGRKQTPVIKTGGTKNRKASASVPGVKYRKKLVALACSTGGPRALQYVIPFLPKNLDAAVLLVQHMPEGFTASLSKRLNELSRINVKEAADGDILQNGTVYIAKGGSQMRLKRAAAGTYTLSVTVEAARNGLKPCADIMYESLMDMDFDEVICVVMTGMGADGTQGIVQLNKTNKIYVIGQDEETCTVYGMPKAIAESGLVDEVLPLKQIADAITRHVGVR